MLLFSFLHIIINHIDEEITNPISVSSENTLIITNSKFHGISSTAITTSIQYSKKVLRIQISDSEIKDVFSPDNSGGAMNLNSVLQLTISKTSISNCFSNSGAALWISSIDSATIEYLTVNNVTSSSGAAISAFHSLISISYSFFTNLHDIGTSSGGSSLFDFGMCSTVSIFRTSISEFTCKDLSIPKVVFRFYLTTSSVNLDTVCISNEDSNSPFAGIYIGDSTATASSYTLQHITFPYYMISSSIQIENFQKEKTTTLDIIHANEVRCKDPDWTFSVSDDPWPSIIPSSESSSETSSESSSETSSESSSETSSESSSETSSESSSETSLESSSSSLSSSEIAISSTDESSSSSESSTSTQESNIESNNILETNQTTSKKKFPYWIIIVIIALILIILLVIIAFILFRRTNSANEELSNSESDIDYDQVALLPSHRQFNDQIVMSSQI